MKWSDMSGIERRETREERRETRDYRPTYIYIYIYKLINIGIGHLAGDMIWAWGPMGPGPGLGPGRRPRCGPPPRGPGRGDRAHGPTCPYHIPGKVSYLAFRSAWPPYNLTYNDDKIGYNDDKTGYNTHKVL